ncbi:PREDICTED: uncharacterized protein LOC109191092 [Ipomoea nil]|uniref:uncharacterized protein LOC109191092 n=1 Tax=Ipomoea nil TaxID=35883 RepID=UPI000901A558|nr:PREDICTED: uncharacterized protein LOC109191092 [Ipomoea nil]
MRVALKFDSCFGVDADKRSGGLALLWNAGVDMEVRGYSNHYIDSEVKGDGGVSSWRFTGFYGAADRSKRRECWNLLRYLSSINTLPWVLMGDCNDLLWSGEKEGRVPHPRWLMRGFGEAIRESGLSNFGFEGCQFTWEKGRGTSEWVREKLDRILVSGTWRDNFPKAKAWSLEGTTSDHLPIFLAMEAVHMETFKRRPRFENSWGRDPGCREVVKREWSRLGECDIGVRLSECGRGVWTWGRNQNRGEVESIRFCQGEMGRLRGKGDNESVRKFGECQRKYMAALRNQSDRWRQRAKEMWYKGGDSNSRFFHHSVNRRRRRNRIRGLRDVNGDFTEDEQRMGDIMVDYFANLFSSAEGEAGPVLECVDSRINGDQNAMLIREVTVEEVKDALFAMHPDKSPGPDGLSPAFFQTYWDIVGPEVVSFCRLFMFTGMLPDHINDTHIVLIPKCKSPESMSDFCPISLCNVVYRIVAKVLANRLRVLLNSIIDPAQSAFVPGRSIVDNVLIAFESAHCLKRQPGNRGGYGALNVDMSKAYDRVEWGFLCKAMSKMGFTDHWVRLMRECISTVRYSVLVEGKEWGPVVPGRGLRQGDPLSPCLFILVAECLSAMLRVREGEGVLHELRVARGALTISHLFFADDCLFFFRANNFEAEIIRDVLREYGRASGQEVNLGKTSMVFGRNVHWEDKEAVCDTLGVHEQQGHGKYLGLPGYIGKRKRDILGFIRDKVRARVMQWGNRFLSRGGREVLLKTVLQSIPNYAMNVFLLPMGLSEEIERLMNSFWWGCERRERGGIRWSRWGDLCVPKKFGGMGFRRVREMNLAMLGKQGWNFMTKPDALMQRKGLIRLSCGLAFGKHRICCSEGFDGGLGMVSELECEGDPWLPDTNNPYITTPAQEYLGNPNVSSLFCVNSKSWDVGVLRDIFCERDVNQILSVPIPYGMRRDVLFWSGDDKGVYSVGSGYRLAVGGEVNGEGVVWRGMWNLRVPPKVKCFFWNLCTKRLPTKDALLIKHVPCDPVCVMCGKANESVVHLFINCEYAHKCWLMLNANWILSYVDSINVWLEEMWTIPSAEMREKLMMVAWAIWGARNANVWRQKHSDPGDVVRQALLYAENWRQARENGEVHACYPALDHHETQNADLGYGEIRVNIDVTMDQRGRRMGFGWTVFDWDGAVLEMVLFAKEGLYRVHEVEAMGAREALSWIKGKGWPRVILETDAQVITRAVTGGVDLSPFGAIIEEIRDLLDQMPMLKFRYVSRKANTVADFIAKKALGHTGEERVEYFDYIPRFLAGPLCKSNTYY